MFTLSRFSAAAGFLTMAVAWNSAAQAELACDGPNFVYEGLSCEVGQPTKIEISACHIRPGAVLEENGWIRGKDFVPQSHYLERERAQRLLDDTTNDSAANRVLRRELRKGFADLDLYGGKCPGPRKHDAILPRKDLLGFIQTQGHRPA